MTRGKEVQDFIKADKKSARERFEEAGYELLTSTEEVIKYREKGYLNKIVWFFLTIREFGVDSGALAGQIDMELNRLIQYQLEELGWL